ncbi:MAG: YebC/PmpR family DNA-binding transcriptional regulator [Patescibacteria group bacterium]|jgi:YebC/PmpR family DNA-binding regulatory protein
MSGHSKWATTKRKKAAIDSKRAKIFTKLAGLITIATRDGKSGDPNFNPSLRMAMDNARAVSMPKENIERAIKRGLGEGGDSVKIEEVTYEAYGPSGVAMLIETLTDNRNRTVSDIKAILNKYSGSMAGSGSVLYQFRTVGEIALSESKSNAKGEELEMVIIDSGADDFDSEDGFYVVRTAPGSLHSVKSALEEKGVIVDSAEIIQVATTPVLLPSEKADSVSNLIEKIEELEDVTNVYTNMA